MTSNHDIDFVKVFMSHITHANFFYILQLTITSFYIKLHEIRKENFITIYHGIHDNVTIIFFIYNIFLKITNNYNFNIIINYSKQKYLNKSIHIRCNNLNQYIYSYIKIKIHNLERIIFFFLNKTNYQALESSNVTFFQLI